MASGLAVGFAIGLGGIAAVVLGAVADSIDLRTALWVTAVAPVPAFLLSLRLPSIRPRTRLTPEAVTP
jgi:FSR family fosmidomycin resistance protein-like MFS transporter